ncbi:hypothetical protein NDR89_23200 [Cupriavidus gilardii]|uniref:Secreted protein n=1 Tax=Cupriavidus gilardii TaxID=82541 RepID=A0ABY4VQH2_9BURK|nr:hypothetical protein [Cupriavidus gilardii]USE79501.1 hypothetical protein NDR89_23200 [Cupriavidus gilardii]
MNDNQLYAVFWKCAAAVLVFGTATIGSCTMHQHRIQSEVLVKSPNPALTQCAFLDQGRKSSAFCIEVARQK